VFLPEEDVVSNMFDICYEVRNLIGCFVFLITGTYLVGMRKIWLVAVRSEQLLPTWPRIDAQHQLLAKRRLFGNRCVVEMFLFLFALMLMDGDRMWNRLACVPFSQFAGPGAASRLSLVEGHDGGPRRKTALSMIRQPGKWMDAVDKHGVGVSERETLSLDSQMIV
jgi:hypothetical protein